MKPTNKRNKHIVSIFSEEQNNDVAFTWRM